MDSSKQLLQHLNNQELNELLSDDGSKLEEMIKESAQIKALESEREMLIASNKSLAEYNLSRQPAYNETREVLRASHKEALEIKEEVEKTRHRLDELTRQTSLDTTLALLQTSAAEAEEESEKLAESFLAGEVPLDSFLTSFLEKRKLSHLRRIKTEKLMEYVRTQAASNGTSPIRPAPQPPGVGVAPYPMPNMPGMPQPTLGYNSNFPFSRPY